jgi:hypothetical protein
MEGHPLQQKAQQQLRGLGGVEEPRGSQLADVSEKTRVLALVKRDVARVEAEVCHHRLFGHEVRRGVFDQLVERLFEPTGWQLGVVRRLLPAACDVQ